MLRGITVESQLVFFARLQGFDRRSARLEIARIVELLNIGPLLNQLPETLSHGQRKKIYLAQSLIGKPELLLLDEPTAGLDPAAAEEVRNLTQSLRQQHTLLISSHNLDEIRNICDEIIVINKGRLVRHSRIDELVQHDRCLTLMLDRAPTPELLESITRITGVTSVIPDPERKERLTVHFQQIRPDELQLLLLSELQRNSVAVLEFNRGTALSGKVAELVNQ